jgi:bifunctional non-homologous end joining protein LigD
MTRQARARARFIAPMKALGSEVIPRGKRHCEIKFDGYRAVAVISGGKVQIWSRNHKPLEGFPEVSAELLRLKCRSAVLDGEIVALDTEGRSRFQLMQNRGAGSAPVVYYLFDIMHLDGRDVMDLPLADRTGILQGLDGGPHKSVVFSPVFNIEPAELFEVAKERGLEGIVAKDPLSRYESDARSGAWVKCKVLAEQEFVIGGYTAPQNSRLHFGAILVGYSQGGRFQYAGKVGTGFDAGSLAALHEKFRKLETRNCPFANLPSDHRPRFGTGMDEAQMKSVTWLRPTLVAQVKFAEWTEEGLLRQPVFLGLRRDKAPRAVRREAGPVYSIARD